MNRYHIYYDSDNRQELKRFCDYITKEFNVPEMEFDELKIYTGIGRNIKCKEEDITILILKFPNLYTKQLTHQ
jgi:hypothetical protein